MKKLLLTLLAMLAVTSAVHAETANKNKADLVITDKNTSIATFMYGYNINDNNYFQLRQLANELERTSSKFDVVWHDDTKQIELVTNKIYEGYNDPIDETVSVEATLSTDKLIIDGKEVTDVTAYKINGNNYYKLRDLAKYLSYSVGWNQELQMIYVDCQPNTESSKSIAYPDNMAPNFNNYNAIVPLENSGDSAPTWSKPFLSSLYDNGNGTFTTVTSLNEKEFCVGIHNADTMELISAKTYPSELPKYGGFYSGASYNYIVFGQDNKEENNDKEVIRVVKYDKAFNRISSCSVYGAYTITPFEAGTVNMSEYQNELVVHTSRTRYLTEDGKNHQSNLTLIIDTDTMQLKNIADAFQEEHVSHSFNQFVKHDGANRVLLDHGDGFPRAIAIKKHDGSHYYHQDLLQIPGKTGANFTGISVGGFEISANNYVTALSCSDLSTIDNPAYPKALPNKRDTLLLLTNRNTLETTSVNLTNHIYNSKHSSFPYLVKLSDDKFLVMWNEYTYQYEASMYLYNEYIIKDDLGVKYVTVDENGNTLTEIKSAPNVVMSTDCQPIYLNGKVLWYNNSVSGKTFYWINP